MGFKLINPESLGLPVGYNNGVMVEAPGRLLFVSGQVGWDQTQKITSPDLVEQFARALANVITVVQEAGGQPNQIARLTIYITDRTEYLFRRTEIGDRYRALMGKHFPAMALVEVKSLLDSEAKVEIEATAVLDVR